MGLEQAIVARLREVIDPETGADVARIRLIEDLRVDGETGRVGYRFRPPSPLCPLAMPLALSIRVSVAGVPGVTGQEIEVVGYVRADELNALLGEVADHAVINLDAVGMGSHLWIVTEGYWLDYGPMKTTEWLNAAIAQAADDLHYSIAYTPCGLGLSDATPFLYHGVPSTWLWKYDDPFWHTPLDDAMHVDPNSFKVTAEIVGLAVLRLANRE
jgi:metal-sulfur cluster biosynthetic enzyme